MIIDDFMSPTTIVCLCLHVKCQIFFFEILPKFGLSRKFSRKFSLSNFTKIRPVEATLILADRQTDKQTERQIDRQI